MPPQSVILESGRTDGLTLRVVFQWRQDRYEHEIWTSDREAEQAVLISTEGAATDPWPPSPPFQQLSVEERAGGRRVILLLGMAGQSHWSGSVESSADPCRLQFDIACRASQPPARLGSTYRCQVDAAGGGEQQVRFLANRLLRLDVGPGARYTLRSGCSELSIQPRGEPSGLPATRCWRYVLTLE